MSATTGRPSWEARLAWSPRIRRRRSSRPPCAASSRCRSRSAASRRLRAPPPWRGMPFAGSRAGFLRWALASEAALAPPAAGLFGLGGLGPAPVGVKAAGAQLAGQGVDLRAGSGHEVPLDAEAPPKASRRRSGSSPALEVRDLWVELDHGAGPRDVLRGIDLVLDSGERVALMGRNGAGKTTLLRAAAGLVTPARGRISTHRGCALLAQSPGDLLVRERVADELPGEAGRQPLDLVGLQLAVESEPRHLSRGARQALGA